MGWTDTRVRVCQTGKAEEETLVVVVTMMGTVGSGASQRREWEDTGRGVLIRTQPM
jgi:hypothetical protein